MPESSLLSPTLRVVPASATDWTLGPLATALATGYGLTADPWQADIVECSLARGANGRFAAATVKVAVARQNGKNAVLEVRELFGMVVLGEKFLHTAHEVKTARKAFRRIASFFENARQYPELAELVLDIRKTNGQEAILLTNGGSIEFIARSKGSGRGFTVDVLVCDEDQDLTDDELAALLPTISAAPLGNPQVILTGTPPDPDLPDAAKGEVARRVRYDAIESNDPNLCCFDFGVPDGPLPDVDDRNLWRQTNPALGTRLNIAEVERERKLMAPEKFARERLGWWGNPEGAGKGAIDMAAWARLSNPTATPPARAVVVIYVSPDRRGASLGVAGDGAEGRTLGMVQTYAAPNKVPAAVAALRKNRNISEVVLHAGTAAESLRPELDALGVEYTILPRLELAKACGWFQSAVDDAKVEHVSQQELDIAAANTRTRVTGEAETWDRKSTRIDITPLVAVAAATHRWALGGPDYDPLDSIY